MNITAERTVNRLQKFQNSMLETDTFYATKR